MYVRCASCRYWGLRNVFIHTLIQYNRRYRKLGFESFLKNHRSFGKTHKDRCLVVREARSWSHPG